MLSDIVNKRAESVTFRAWRQMQRLSDFQSFLQVTPITLDQINLITTISDTNGWKVDCNLPTSLIDRQERSSFILGIICNDDAHE